MFDDVAFLLVTCCLEPSRAKILNVVVDNIKTLAPELMSKICVFDNASTEPGVVELLAKNFINVYQSSRNVGYWSAINWWLSTLKSDKKYTYIIESDMVHSDFLALNDCKTLLETHSDVGSVRTHEFSFEKRHIYNKDVPVKGSKRNIWQSFTNHSTGKKINFSDPLKIDDSTFYVTNFLTQLPSLNRLEVVSEVFKNLLSMPSFSERDFQGQYYQRYQKTAIIDGGLFNCDFGGYENKDAAITGSWSSDDDLKRIGYQPTRFASIQTDFDVIKI